MIQIVTNIQGFQIPPHFVARMQRAKTTQLVLNVPHGANVTSQQLYQQLYLLLNDVEKAIENESAVPVNTGKQDNSVVRLIESGDGVLQSSSEVHANTVCS